MNVPKELGVEFAPLRLVTRNSLDEDDVQTGALDSRSHIIPRIKPALYRLRLSIALKRLEGEEGPSQLAFGVRTNFCDNADPNTNKSGGKEDKNWNKAVLETALAFRTSSSDSGGTDMFTDNVSWWVTGGVPLRCRFLAGNGGQVLVGYQGNRQKAMAGAPWNTSTTFSLRTYLGSNDYKIYLEAQQTRMKDKNGSFLNSGIELKLRPSTWMVFSVGRQGGDDIKGYNVVSNVSLRADPSSL